MPTIAEPLAPSCAPGCAFHQRRSRRPPAVRRAVPCRAAPRAGWRPVRASRGGWAAAARLPHPRPLPPAPPPPSLLPTLPPSRPARPARTAAARGRGPGLPPALARTHAHTYTHTHTLTRALPRCLLLPRPPPPPPPPPPPFSATRRREGARGTALAGICLAARRCRMGTPAPRAPSRRPSQFVYKSQSCN